VKIEDHTITQNTQIGYHKPIIQNKEEKENVNHRIQVRWLKLMRYFM